MKIMNWKWPTSSFLFLHLIVSYPKFKIITSLSLRETWVQSQVESYQKTLKMVLDTTLLNTQHYKVRFKGKVEQSWEWSSALPYTLV